MGCFFSQPPVPERVLNQLVVTDQGIWLYPPNLEPLFPVQTHLVFTDWHFRYPLTNAELHDAKKKALTLSRPEALNAIIHLHWALDDQSITSPTPFTKFTLAQLSEWKLGFERIDSLVV